MKRERSPTEIQMWHNLYTPQGQLMQPKKAAPIWPTVKQAFPSMKWAMETLKNGASALCFMMPDGESKLWWTPWPEVLEPPLLDISTGHYRTIKIYEKDQTMPRRTWCFDHAYPFSGQTHPVEAETPPSIRALYQWANAACGYPNDGKNGFNMTLVNHYASGRHCIGKHRDDEREFGAVHDVLCFVTGEASRKLVIKGGSNTTVLSVSLPKGVYCMVGRRFQKNYTHEIPQLHPSIFKLLKERGPLWIPNSWPTHLTDLELAEWCTEWADTFKTLLRKSAPGAKGARLVSQFEEWARGRTSFTLRNFSV